MPSRRQKILNKILAGSKNIRFDDFVLLLEGYGFVLERMRGSHFVFSHSKLQRAFPVQSEKGKAKIYQIRQLISLVEQFNLKLIDDETPDDEESDT